MTDFEYQIFNPMRHALRNPFPETLYETTPKWHSFFFDLTGRFFGRRLG
jgi:hypothetical protein